MTGRTHIIDTNLPGAAACGAAVALYLTARVPAAMGLAAAGAAALAAVLLHLPRGASGACGGATSAAARAGALSAALAFGLLVGAGVRLGVWVGEERTHLPVASTAVRVAEGTIRGRPRADRGGWSTTMEIDLVETASGEYGAHIEAPVYGLQRRPAPGRRIRVEGRLTPGDHGHYLVADSAVERGWAGSLARIADASTGLLARKVERAMSALGPAAWLSRALLLGRTDGAPAYAEDVFRRSGTAHILALSGMHLGILIALSVMLLAPFMGRRRALFAALGFVGVYLGVVGFRASLARASLMFALGTAAVALGRRPDPMRILAVSFIALAVAAPSSIDGLSFQLSFAALAGILIVGRRLDRRLQPVLPAVLRRPLAASVGAQLATLPLLLAAFGVARPVGVIATLVMAPLAVLFVWVSVGAIAAVLSGGDLIADAASALLAALEQALLATGEYFSRAPGLYADAEWAPVAGALVVAIGAAGLRLDAAPTGGAPTSGAAPGGAAPAAASEDPDAVWGPL
ncbi:MAG: hypothetical protein GVY14_10870 [Spirochaetes bacterium]|nr:hypothetical protein [Spirochaetota bacterium]